MKDIALASVFTLLASGALLLLTNATEELTFIVVPVEGELQSRISLFLFLLARSAIVGAIFGVLAGYFVSLPSLLLGFLMGVGVVLPDVDTWFAFLELGFSLGLGGNLVMFGYWLLTPFMYWFFVSVGSRYKERRNITSRSSGRPQAGAT